MMPDEKGPWAMARAFGAALVDRLGDRLAGAYVVGSLAHSGFVEGISRVDVIVVIRGEGSDASVDVAIDDARREALEASIPLMKGDPAPRLRSVVLGESELSPPYAAERETAPEVLRLADEGVKIAGEDVRETIQRPTANDYLAYIRYFDALVRDTAFRTDSDELPPYPDLYALVAAACRHYVFAKEHLVIWPKHDALMAFWMGHERHDGVPLVRTLVELGPNPEPEHVPGDLGERVRAFWQRTHGEILK